MDLRCRESYLIQCLSFASSQDAIVNDLRRCLVVLRGLESLRCWQALEAFKRPEVKRVKRLVTDDFDLNLNIRRRWDAWCFPRRSGVHGSERRQARETVKDFRWSVARRIILWDGPPNIMNGLKLRHNGGRRNFEWNLSPPNLSDAMGESAERWGGQV
ncbi:MAG: hypothetical protein ACTS6P_01880 [Candidatus Hodgkinia cicadicola]